MDIFSIPPRNHLKIFFISLFCFTYTKLYLAFYYHLFLYSWTSKQFILLLFQHLILPTLLFLSYCATPPASEAFVGLPSPCGWGLNLFHGLFYKRTTLAN